MTDEFGPIDPPTGDLFEEGVDADIDLDDDDEPKTAAFQADIPTPPETRVEPPPQRPGGEFDLIEAARLQARHRSAPSMGGLGAATIPGYQILRELHRGGQGVVYLATQEGTQRTVAVKVMREGPFAGPHDRVRFEREIRVLAQLKNPNIVTIHDSGAASGCFFYVMDYIAGLELDEYVTQNRLSHRQIIELFTIICQAVNAAHLRGVIHRDLKPSNIRVTPEGAPHVLDFGLAKVSENTAADQSLPTQMTMSGQFVGSLPWSSPEQARGEASKIDVRTDVYALGVMLYQMLTGEFPYPVEGAMREVMDHITSTSPQTPRKRDKSIPRELELVTLKALSKHRDDRYQTAGELARDLERFLAGEPVEARRDSRYVVRKLIKQAWPIVTALLVLLIVSLVGLIIVSVQLAERARERRAWEAERTELRERLDDLGRDLDNAIGDAARYRRQLLDNGITPQSP
ncbi:MAG: serine/threonine-protein kinase [Planctomycetota bacterium]